MNDPSHPILLLVRAGPRLCGIPISSVIETMRPLAASPIAGAPPFVRGVTIVRGDPAPVVDLDALLGGGAPSLAPARYVTVRTGARTAALAVDEVVGVAELDPRQVRRMPLVSDACAGSIEALSARDGDLVAVLAAARLVPDDVLRVFEGWEADA